MFAKTGFVLRSLFVASMLASLVACTFEDSGNDGEEEGSTSSAAKTRKNKGNDKGDATAPSTSADGGNGWEGDGGGAWCWNGCSWTQECPDDIDGGPWGGGSDGGIPPWEPPMPDASVPPQPSHDAGYWGH